MVERLYTVVANAGPLIALARIGQLDLLSTLYGEVVVPWQSIERLREKRTFPALKN